jgi:hypothetical protein
LAICCGTSSVGFSFNHVLDDFNIRPTTTKTRFSLQAAETRCGFSLIVQKVFLIMHFIKTRLAGVQNGRCENSLNLLERDGNVDKEKDRYVGSIRYGSSFEFLD